MRQDVAKGGSMKHSTGGAVAERMSKSLWEDFPRDGSSWDDLEDGLTRSRATVLLRPPEPAPAITLPEHLTPSLTCSSARGDSGRGINLKLLC
jgi:hypothetical protein